MLRFNCFLIHLGDRKYFVKAIIAIVCGLFYSVFLANAQCSYKVICKDSNHYVLQVKVKTVNGDSLLIQKKFAYKVLKYRKVDINADGNDDFILEVEKSTVLDSIIRRRLNIWQIVSNRIVPLWLSSFLPHPLVDFEIRYTGNKPHVITIEKDKNDRYLIAEYKWQSFGLSFIQYFKINLTFDAALLELKNLSQTP